MASPTRSRIVNPSKPPRIGIVGAGISGLRCADVLLERGFDVTIIEGRDRVGGRMHQTTLPSGHLVDLGPNWIHGTEHNPILDLAKETNTQTHSWEEHSNVFDENGEYLRGGDELGEEMWGIIVQAFKYSEENSATIEPQKSLYDFFLEKVQNLFVGDKNCEEKRRIVKQMTGLWGAFVGSPVERQSLKFFWLEECIDGENLFCASTYKNILALIAEPGLEKAAIKYLTKIIRFETDGTTPRLTAEEGQVFEFDEVVVTSPLGWLKANTAAFHPPLPARLRQAIDCIGYGSLEKVYITFPRSFWLKDGDTPEEQFTGFTQWLSPLYASKTNPKKWTQECVDLATLPEGCAHPTLLYYIFGDQSVTLSRDLLALPTEKERQEHIIEFFEPYYSKLPYYDKGLKDCFPVSCLATNWVADELAGNGSYSTFRTGLQEGDKDIEIMREGLPSRKLWFAGEHVAPFVALGTVTGAYWSGETVAKRIAEAYGMDARITINEIVAKGDGVKDVNVRGFADKGLEK